MLRKLSSLIALASVCFVGAAAHAQDSADSAASSFELASYGRDYKSASQQTVAATPASATMGQVAVGPGGLTGVAGQPQAMAYGRVWGGGASNRDCARFNHYPYVYYPQNFRSSEYYRSSNSMYNRYPPEMQIPVYNRHWHNYYPSPRRYHAGHQFILDVF